MPRRVISPRLVGRDAELAQLRSAFDRAAAETTALFVGGEAGVGKTRLVREFAAEARASGAMVWSGGCSPLAEGLLPYGPIVALVRAAAAEIGPGRLRQLAGA